MMLYWLDYSKQKPTICLYQAGKLMLCLGRVRYTEGIYKESIRYWTRCIDLCKISHDTEVQIEARIGRSNLRRVG